jgi:hypothetical protein
MALASYINRAAIPLLSTALARALEVVPTDAVGAGLASYLVELIEDECGKDILPDLALLGADLPGLLRRPVPPTIAALIGSQYFWIRHAHPVSILGYLEAVETTIGSPEAVERLIERTGFPQAVYTQLIAHAVRHYGHGPALHAALDRLPLESEHHELLAMSAMQTVQLMSRALDELFEQEEPPSASAEAG